MHRPRAQGRGESPSGLAESTPSVPRSPPRRSSCRSCETRPCAMRHQGLADKRPPRTYRPSTRCRAEAKTRRRARDRLRPKGASRRAAQEPRTAAHSPVVLHPASWFENAPTPRVWPGSSAPPGASTDGAGKTGKEIFDTQFRKDEAEGHSQNDHRGRHAIRDRIEHHGHWRLSAERYQIDEAAGHSEQVYARYQRYDGREGERRKRQSQSINDRRDNDSDHKAGDERTSLHAGT